jgi:uncharacterized protein YjbI with pentapeptide repeats/energy-coupling factor transporter ATP-binding protein EcfA2
LGRSSDRIDGREATMIQPQRAPVTPRVLSPDTGDVIPLEEAILALVVESQGVIEIVGGPGSGKTTALGHLAAVLPPDPPVLLLDDADPVRAARESAQRTVVYTATTPHLSIAAKSLYLASWTEDELIEYLLAVHPDRCGSVMGRLSGAEYRRRLSGVPQLWRIVLDEMARGADVVDIQDALRRGWQSHVPDDATEELAAAYSLAAVLGDASRAATSVAELTRLGRGEPLIGLLRHRVMTVLLAADCLTRRLTAPHPSFLDERLPRDLVEEMAVRVGSCKPALASLRRLVEGRDRTVHAMAASILHATGCGWKPQRKRAPNLEGAYLEGASWQGVDLSRAKLRQADLIAADLSGAKLDRADAHGARLRHAVLHRASLDGLDASKADLAHADLSQASGRATQFDRADLSGVDFTGAMLVNADFQSAKLSGTRFRGCDLRHAKLGGAVVEGTDFTDANLSLASFRALNLQSAVLSGACMASVDMTACRLEHFDLPGANFEGAYLVRAYLTGSSMPGANLRGARLRGAGLACIQWEGADLRDADLRQISFYLGSSRSGRVDSPIASEGTRTGFYTDEFEEQHYRTPEEIRKANLRGADLRGARVDGVDFYLVDLRDVRCTIDQMDHFRRCGAILYDRP